MMSVSKPLCVSTKELYWQVFSLTYEMNYSRIEHGIKYHVVDRNSFNTISCRFDSVIIFESSQCNSIDKLVQVFKNVDTIITSDIDLSQIHEQLKTENKNLAYFKLIVLIDHSDNKALVEILELEPLFITWSTDEMNLNESFISDITTFSGFNKKEVKKLLKRN